jgi:ribosomal protein S18 acetylase RimI-like enzyme
VSGGLLAPVVSRLLLAAVEVICAAWFPCLLLSLRVGGIHGCALYPGQAIGMYEQFGYNIYRQVIDYYQGESGSEDAYDMRKACARDVDKQSVIPLNPLRVPPSVLD